jgi:hypothetical protein
MSENFKLRGRDAVEWRKVDGEIVALIKSSSTYIAINAGGAILWPALANGATRDDLIELLQGEFGIDAGLAARDVDAFVDAMRGQDLLEPEAEHVGV